MADHDSIVSSDKIKAVADAIREKTHKDNLMTLDEMPDEIASISGGGGNVPECGIVPTSWSSVGYVLSADVYGNVVAYGCGLSGECPHFYDPNTVDYESGSYFGDYNQYSYLRNITFASTTETIYGEAFSNCAWLQLTELPDTLTYIGDKAFMGCANVVLQEIPESVTFIGNGAFSDSCYPGHYCMPYSNESTYNIGDTVYYQSYIYTCLVAISTPEEFNSAHWLEEYCPELLGVYDPNAEYSNGDIVYDGTYICTVYIQDIRTPNICGYGDSPEVSEVYNENHIYSIGDIVGYDYDGSTSDSDCVFYTSFENNNSTVPGNDYCSWVEGSYPELLGEYDPTVQYHAGDVVVSSGEGSDDRFIYTATKDVIDVDPLDPDYTGNYWASGYAPEIIGDYDTDSTYSVGDVISIPSSTGAGIYTCISPVTTPEDFDYDKWYGGYYPEVLGIYDEHTEYHAGDVVAVGSGHSRVYTAIQTSVGHSPWPDSDYWIEGYYPNLQGIYNSSASYSVGDVVYVENGQLPPEFSTYGVFTFISAKHVQEEVQLLNTYCPQLVGIYDPTHTYNPTDVVLYNEYGDNYSASDIYICANSTSVTGEWDSTYWAQIWDSVDDYTVRKLIFRGTPGEIGFDAFSSSGYNVALVPWSEYSEPDISNQFPLVIYEYGNDPA